MSAGRNRPHPRKLYRPDLLRILVALLLLGAVVASSANAARTQRPDTKAMVLALSDLPAGFSQTDGYYATDARAAAESSSVSVADYRRWGRLTGYDATFTRDSATGP